jgi:phage/conjugal plasmid C-4 type zinc finger TraR family protein
MADVADLAEAREAEIRADALAAHRLRSHTTTPSLMHCAECELAIPEPRRLAVPGVRLCVNCQGRREQMERVKK